MDFISTIFSDTNMKSANVAAAAIGVVGIFIGAVLTLAIRRLEVELDRRHERRRVMLALAAEVQDNLRDIEKTFSPGLYTEYQALVAKVRQADPFIPVWTYSQRSIVYEEHVKDIGRLPAKTASLLIRFYGSLKDTYASIDAFEKPAYLKISPFGRAMLVYRVYEQLTEQHRLGYATYHELTGSHPAHEGAVGEIRPFPPPVP